MRENPFLFIFLNVSNCLSIDSNDEREIRYIDKIELRKRGRRVSDVAAAATSAIAAVCCQKRMREKNCEQTKDETRGGNFLRFIIIAPPSCLPERGLLLFTRALKWKREIFFPSSLVRDVSTHTSPHSNSRNIWIVTCECQMKNVNVMSFALLLYMDIFPWILKSEISFFSLARGEFICIRKHEARQQLYMTYKEYCRKIRKIFFFLGIYKVRNDGKSISISLLLLNPPTPPTKRNIKPFSSRIYFYKYPNFHFINFFSIECECSFLAH